jgi:hypothetical protein
MTRMYPVVFENIAISTAVDLWDIAPATNKPIRLHGFNLSNVGGTADAGDAQEELLRLRIVRGLATVGSGGTAVSAAPGNTTGDANWSFTARTNDTTVAVVGAGSTIECFADGWNVRVPYAQIFTPEQMGWITAGDTRLCIRLMAAPADAVNCSGTAWIEEFG